MSTTARRLPRAIGVAALIAIAPGLVAHADDDDRGRRGTELLGRAVLPVNTYAPGPSSGNFFAGQTINGITFPLPSQPVLGISAIVEGRRRGEWLAMPDNGFGNEANSKDFLIRAYRLRLDLKTAEGGSGAVHVGEFIQFSDPNNLIGFAIEKPNEPGRPLTGSDIDPESLQVGRNGDLWVGDEFGPWILHFDSQGRLLEPPISLPGDIRSPDNPPLGQPVTSTHPRSRGLEGMGIAGRYLYPLLEGPTDADAATDPTVRRMFEYDTKAGAFTDRQWVYRVDLALNAQGQDVPMLVSDVAPLDRHRLVVMERDGVNPGVERAVYVVDLREVGADGALVKRKVLDLAAIPDPRGVAQPPIHEGDIGLGNPATGEPFRVVCESVEAIRVVDRDKVLVGCDNNFPNRGRHPTLADDNEFIVVRVPELSNR